MVLHQLLNKWHYIWLNNINYISLLFPKNQWIRCHNLNLGLTTKARGMERCGSRMQPWSHIYTPRVQKSVREWIHTFPSGFPLWKLESLWSFEFSKNKFRGQNSLDWRFYYTIGKPLRRKCLKWACMIHLNIYNTSCGHNKGRESKCQFNSWPLKVKNCLIFVWASGVLHILQSC